MRPWESDDLAGVQAHPHRELEPAFAPYVFGERAELAGQIQGGRTGLSRAPAKKPFRKRGVAGSEERSSPRRPATMRALRPNKPQSNRDLRGDHRAPKTTRA